MITKEVEMKIRNKIPFLGNKNKTEKQYFHSLVANEKGFVLVVSFILLIVITIMGALALSTATTEVMIAGNQRMEEINQESADGGREITMPVINDTVYYDRINTVKYPIIADIKLNNELQINDSDEDGIENMTSTVHEDRTDAIEHPDIRFSIPSGQPVTIVSVDVDYLFATHGSGSAIEFASGTEGMGKGMSGGSLVYYKANAFSQNIAGAETEVGSLYRYVVRY
jgi:Na+-transporting methylmalonyl-CoA/oxaloacetate decarboxylase gamma subunit